MDEQLANVLNFIFIPESTLSIVFLVIFIIMIVFGIYIYIYCRRRIDILNEVVDSEYEQVASCVTPEMYLKKRLEKISAVEGILESIPDYFVSIGILATFIGLGVAVQGATELLSAEKFEIDKMVSLLGIIAFKFQTSVWGIAFSLMFRRFGVEMYFVHRQNVIDEVREILRVRERDSIQTLLEQQNILVTAESGARREAEKNLLTRLEEMFNKNIASKSEAQKLDNEQQTKRHEALLKSLVNFQTSMENNFGSQENKLQQIMAQQESIFQSQTKANHKWEVENSKQLKEWQNSLSGEMKKNDEIQENQLMVLNAVLEKFSSLDEINKLYARTAEQFGSDVQSFGQQVENFRGEIQASQKKIDDTLVDMCDKHLDTLCIIRQHIQELQRIFLRDENDYVRQTRESFQQVLRDSEDAFKNILSDNLTHIHEGYLERLDEFKSVTNDLDEVLKQIDERVEKLQKEMIAEQKNLSQVQVVTLKQMEGRLEELNQKAQKQQEIIQEVGVRTQAQQQVLQEVGAMTQAQQQVLQEVGAMAREQQQALQEVKNKAQAQQEVLQEVGAKAQAQQEVLQEVGIKAQVQQEVLQEVGAKAKAQQEVLQEIGDISKEQQKHFVAIQREFKDSVNKLYELQMNMLQGQKENVLESEKKFTNLLYKLQTVQADFNESIQQNQNTLSDRMIEALNTIQSSMDSLKNEAIQSRGILVDGQNAGETWRQSVEEYQAEVLRLMSGLTKQLATQVNQNLETASKKSNIVEKENEDELL